MNLVELSERFGKMWKDARTAAGFSQVQAAKAMGVSRATIENWENGTSSPSQKAGFIYFYKLGVQPLPYYLRVLYPVEMETVDTREDDEEVTKALLTMMRDLPTTYKKKLLYVAYGDHGSSPAAVLDMVCAHLHTPLLMRIGVAALIKSNFVLALSIGRLIGGSQAMPDVVLLERAITRAREAVKQKNESYSAL